MGGPVGPRPDPGPGGRAKRKPKILQKGGVPFTVEDVTPKPKKSPRQIALERTGETMKAALAIKRGKAEAHPRMGKPGALGELEGLTPREKGSVERTFRESLERSAPRRGIKPKPSPERGRLMAGARKPKRRVVRRASPRTAGSGR